MSDYSMVIIVARLTRDPELKYGANGGLPYATLSLAVNRQQAEADGTVRKYVSFIEATVYRHQAELCCQLLKKGSTCMVVGSLRQDRWTDSDGKSRSRLNVVADRVQFLDRRIEVPVPVSEKTDGEPQSDEGDADKA